MISVTDKEAAGVMIINHCHMFARTQGKNAICSVIVEEKKKEKSNGTVTTSIV